MQPLPIELWMEAMSQLLMLRKGAKVRKFFKLNNFTWQSLPFLLYLALDSSSLTGAGQGSYVTEESGVGRKRTRSSLCQGLQLSIYDQRNSDGSHKPEFPEFSEDRNNLEKLTLALLSHLPTAVLYVHDLSGECGNSPSDQKIVILIIQNWHSIFELDLMELCVSQ